MKRILILCMACMVLMAGVASAEILKGRDSFTNGLSVSSSVEAKSIIQSMIFSKENDGGLLTYEIYIAETNMKEYIISNIPMEIKIDDFPTCKLKEYRYKITGPDSYGVNYNASITAIIPRDVVENIKNSKKVAIRFEDNYALRRIYVLPEATLNEWKQVIATEE